MISNLIFDLGNVLVRLDYEGWRTEMKKLFRDPSFLDSEDYKLLCNKYMEGKLGTILFLNAIIKVSKETVQARNVIDAWNSLILDFPEDRMRLLNKLKEKYDLFLLSNNCEMHVEYSEKKFLKQHGLPDYNERYFLRTFYSQEMGAIKPNRSIFNQVVATAEIKPEESLFIDDFSENVKAAKKMGFQIIHLKEFDQLEQELIKAGILDY